MVDLYEISVLAEDYENKRLRFHCMSAMNTYGLSPEEGMKQSIAYHQAESEMIQAWRKLEEAKFRS